MPSNLFKPVSVQIATNFNFDEQEKLAQNVKTFLENHGEVFGDNVSVESDIKKYKSDFSITFDKNGMNAFELRTVIRNKKVELKLEVKRAYLKALRNENPTMGRKEVKEKLMNEMKEILSQIVEQA
jgi:hypothetical protein